MGEAESNRLIAMKSILLGYWIPEDEDNRLSQNVSKKLPFYTV